MTLRKLMNEDLNQRPENEDIFTFSSRIANIPGLIKLTLGEPDFATPLHIKEAAIKAILEDQSHYTDPRGTFALRQSIVEFLHRHYDLNYDPDNQIVVTLGVSEAIHDICLALLNEGDEVLIPTPIYPMYMPNIEMAGAKPVYINLAEDDFNLTPERLEMEINQHPNARAIVLNYPNNPLGTTYNREQLTALANVIKRHDIFCISDEIYSELTYDHSHVSLGSIIPDQTLVLNGVSKAFAMTGWRVGFVCGPEDMIQKINDVHISATTAVTTNAQAAASEAFQNGDEDAQTMKAEYQKRRTVIKDGLHQLGFETTDPAGAFYVFAKIPSEIKISSQEFAHRLAEEGHVGCIAGSIFGDGGEGYVRFSYASSIADIKQALAQMKPFLKKLQNEMN